MDRENRLAELLRIYLGRDAGERVADGSLSRGESLDIVAAIMVADIRESTPLIQSMETGDFISLLNRIFDLLVPPITRAGGEVLQFTGDGLLAVFPETPEAREQGIVCPIAVAGAYGSAVEGNRAIKEADPDCTVGFGLSYGTVAYGNVGTDDRLTFTVISAEVNRADRLQRLCPLDGSNIAMSETFAQHVQGNPVRHIGQRALKGFEAPADVYVPG